MFNNSDNRGIYSKALKLAVPMMIQSGITNAVGLVDNLMVGSLGTESMTAVSIAGQLIFIFNLAIFGGLSGPGIYCSQYYGRGDKDGFQNVVRLKYWISAVCLLVGLAAFILAGVPLVSLYLHDSGNSAIDASMTLSLGVKYLHIMLWGFVPFTITQVYASTLREMEESVKPMVAGIVSVVVDIVFNYLLIYGKFGFPRLGVSGAAIATVMARCVELVVVVLWTHCTIERYPFLKGIYRTLRLKTEGMRVIIIKSVPIFLNEFFWAGGMAALTQCYSVRGLEVVAGINISNAICNLLNVVFIAMGSAVGILTGQALGASKFKEAKEDAGRLMLFSGALCIILSVVLIAFSGIFPELYNTDESVKSLGRLFIIVTAVFFPLQGYLNALYFTIRAGGKTVITFLFDSIYTWCVPVVIAYILCSHTTLSIIVVYTVVQALDFVKTGVGYVLYKKEIWINNLVAE